MKFGPGRALFLLIFCVSCGSTERLSLQFRSGTPAPDFVFSAQLAGSGSLNLSLESTASLGLLRDWSLNCAEDLELYPELPPASQAQNEPCVGLAAFVGQEIFEGQAISSSNSLSPEIEIGDQDSFLFVYFVYGAGDLSANPRCLQLAVLEKQAGELIYLSDQGLIQNPRINLALEDPSLGNNCFSLD